MSNRTKSIVGGVWAIEAPRAFPLSRSLAFVVTIFAGVDGYVNILDAVPFIVALPSDRLAAAPQALFTRSKHTNITSIDSTRETEPDRRGASNLENAV
jgi:hypothetical protein